MTWFGLSHGGAWLYTGVVFAFVIHPLLDMIFGKQLPREEIHSPNPIAFDILIWIYLPTQILLFHLSFVHFSELQLSLFEIIGLILSLGTMSGALGITLAHELIHRRHPLERGIGIMLLLMVNYAHFRIEHVYGHHKHVATPKDPATARTGESLYHFWFRSVTTSWLSAWRIEHARTQKSSILYNRVNIYAFIQMALAFGIYYFYGSFSLIIFLAQSLVAVLILESVNFIEHYGLVRKEIAPGKYEAVTELHSWDSRHRMTNWFLFNLGKHAHHHFEPSVPYQALSSKKGNQALSYGYSTQILLAMIGIHPKKD